MDESVSLINECTNTDILIEALQSNVNVSSTVKSVTWLNG